MRWVASALRDSSLGRRPFAVTGDSVRLVPAIRAERVVQRPQTDAVPIDRLGLHSGQTGVRRRQLLGAAIGHNRQGRGFPDLRLGTIVIRII